MSTLETSMAEMSVATKLITPEIDWTPKELGHPMRSYSKINVINGVNTGTLSTSTQGAFSFQIPAKVLSLKDSYVSLDLAIPTTTNTCSFIAGTLGNIFSRVVITADNNTVLADINDFHRFNSMLCAPSMKFETLEQECVPALSYLPFGADAEAIAKRNPFNVLVKNSRDYSVDGAGDGTVTNNAFNLTPVDRFTGGTTRVHQPNTNPNSYRHWIQKASASAGESAYSLQFRLKDLLPHTVCALDQLLYFGGSQLQFDFYINSKDYIGALQGTLNGISSSASLGAITFANFSFNLCVENNVNTSNAIIQQVKNEGLTIPIPYIYGSKTSITAGTSHNVNQVITRSAGGKLKFVAWAPFYNDGSEPDLQNSHTWINCATLAGQGTYTNVFTSYNTSLDNIFIKSQSTIDCTKGEHWLYNKNELRGSALQGVEALSNDFVHIDSWLGKSLCEYDPSISDGLSINENHTWGLTSTTVETTLQHYVYYCMERKLVVGNFSVQVV
jgi:hypothetical protein